MLTPSLNTVMTRLLIVAAVLAALVFVAPAIFAQEADEPMEVEYAENGTDAVITFTSTDPEGADILWDVTGLDADDFEIDARGMLTFNNSPDYENPSDRARDDDEGTTDVDEMATSSDNLYIITVRATEMMEADDTGRALSTETDVIVEVTNVNEGGMVMLNRLQPEVATPIMAELEDDDNGIETNGEVTTTGEDSVTLGWQWYVSKVTNPIDDAENHWIPATGDVDSNDPRIYTPAGDRVENTDPDIDDDPDREIDEDKYLRAVVKYLDMGKAVAAAEVSDVRTAIGVSMNPVRAEVSSDLDGVENPENGSPGLGGSASDYERTISESAAVGDPVGDPVVATDPDDDTLTYELDIDLFDPNDGDEDMGPDDDPDHNVHYFSIDMATGQISVAKRLDYDDNANQKYTFVVMAVDPSGETAHREVTVKVTDANDAPRIMGSLSEADIANNDNNNVDVPKAAAEELRVNEKDDDIKEADYPYTGMPDMPLPAVGLQTADPIAADFVVVGLGAKNVFTAMDNDARGQIFWDLEGDDADDFVLTSTGLPLSTGFGGPNEPIMLRFRDAPDFENPTDKDKDSVYKVTLVADDKRGGKDTRSLTIFVDNVPEKGGVVISPDQPLTDNLVTAAVEDPDNGVAVVTWQWTRRATFTAATIWEVIPGATTATYTPVEADNKKTDRIESDDGYYLRAIATYTDITSDMDDPDTVLIDERTQKDEDNDDSPEAKDAATEADGTSTYNLYRVMVTSKNAVRVSPVDPEAVDAPEFSSASYDRMVVENAEVGSIVGPPVQVMPELNKDGEPETTFTYDLKATVTGDDDNFDIDEDSGQIRVKAVGFDVDALPAGVIADCDETSGNDVADCPDVDDPVLDYEGANTFTLHTHGYRRQQEVAQGHGHDKHHPHGPQ